MYNKPTFKQNGNEKMKKLSSLQHFELTASQDALNEIDITGMEEIIGDLDGWKNTELKSNFDALTSHLEKFKEEYIFIQMKIQEELDHHE